MAGWCLSVYHRVGGHSFLWFPDNGGARGQFGCWLPGQSSRKYYRNHGVGKIQVSLTDSERQGLFGTGAGPAGSPPKAGRPGYLLYTVNIPLKQLRSLSSPAALISMDVRSKQDHRRESGD